MSEELKKNIVIQMIKSFKNRAGWDNEYVEENYTSAIEYMMLNFDRIYKMSLDGAISSKTQGQRSITYKSGFTNIVQADLTLKALLGSPLLGCY